MRLMQVCTLVSGLARMIQVILQSAPDMANIMILLFTIMLVRYLHQVLSPTSPTQKKAKNLLLKNELGFCLFPFPFLA